MNKFYEKHFARFEMKRRTKLGQKKFLEIYIPRFTRYIKMMKWLLPLVTIVTFINVILNINMYYAHNNADYLVISYIWGLATILWLVNYILHLTHRFKYIQMKVMQFQEELKTINDNQKNNG